MLRRFEKDVFSGLAWPLERWISAGSLVATTPVLPRSDAPWLNLLEAAAPAIGEEFARLEQDCVIPAFGDVSRDQRRIGGDEGWNVLFLYGAGFRDPDVCERCPRTAAIVEAVPNLVSAFFSMLRPGKHIKPHRGLFRGIVRAHLALEVPGEEQNCWMRVADQTLHWKKHRAFCFDDTYDHEVKNETDERRVVLIVDAERPLRLAQRVATRAIVHAFRYTGYVRSARENQRRLTSQAFARD